MNISARLVATQIEALEYNIRSSSRVTVLAAVVSWAVVVTVVAPVVVVVVVVVVVAVVVVVVVVAAVAKAEGEEKHEEYDGNQIAAHALAKLRRAVVLEGGRGEDRSSV